MDLVLNSFGTSLQVENGLFLVKHADGKQLIDPQTLTSIMISRGAKISSDAALLAIEKEIEVLFIDKSGKPSGRIWSVKYGSISTIRKKQVNFLDKPEAISWLKELICEKLDNQVALMLSLSASNKALSYTIDKAVQKVVNLREKTANLQAEKLSDLIQVLRGLEGAASRVYFATISSCLPDELKFTKRSQNPAMDVFNMLLNYAYGILYGKVEGALIKAGIDPYVGIMHRDDYNRPVLVYDVIERFRVWADYVVVGLAAQNVFRPDSYTIKEDGSYWLENSGKRILIQAFNDYLNEIIKIKGVERSRLNQISMYAQSLARLFEGLPD